MSTQALASVNCKIEKSKIEKAKKYFNAKTNSQVITKMFDWFDYSNEINSAMKKVRGKGKIKKVYG